MTAPTSCRFRPAASDVSKQFFRSIRPRAQRVDAKSSDAKVMAVAFPHPTIHAFTAVAINTSSSSKTLAPGTTGP